jgi:tRNA (mo5U34)-methyltransferase
MNGAGSTSAESGWGLVQDCLGAGQQHALVWHDGPQLKQVPSAVRRLARLVSRAVLFPSRWVINRQGLFNVSLLSAVEALGERLRRAEQDRETLAQRLLQLQRVLTEKDEAARRREAEPEPPPFPPLEREREDYGRAVGTFLERARARGYGDLSKYYWYHTVDLGDGLVTPGDYDHRPNLPAFRFPDDMRGMHVLDVGSATGFYAFEFEKRGAEVVSVELPGIEDWDIAAADRERVLGDMARWCRLNGGDPEGQGGPFFQPERYGDGLPKGTLDEVNEYAVHGPFEFCRRVLKSNVRRCLSSVYDLTPRKLGRDGFDLIYAGDVFVHVMGPLKGLDVLASLCKGTLVMSQELLQVSDDLPVSVYLGGCEREGDARGWWHGNRLCWEQMLRRVGFNRVEVVGRHRGIVRREWQPYDRAIVHATR